MDDKTREKYIKQIITTAELVDSEIKLISAEDFEREMILHQQLIWITTFFRYNDAPLTEPGFTDLLRLIANITDLTIEHKRKIEGN